MKPLLVTLHTQHSNIKITNNEADVETVGLYPNVSSVPIALGQSNNYKGLEHYLKIRNST